MTTEKRCPQCGEIKPLDEFYRNSTRKDGHTTYCKICIAQYSKKYHATHADECKERLQRWRDNNREHIRARDRQYRLDKPEIERAKERRYREKHPDKIREKNRVFRENNKDYFKLKYRERKAIIKARSDGTVTKEKLDRLYDEQKGLCPYCGRRLDMVGMNIDHTIPISRGGMHTIDNIKLVCPTCNLSKGTKLEEEWADRLQKKGYDD